MSRGCRRHRLVVTEVSPSVLSHIPSTTGIVTEAINTASDGLFDSNHPTESYDMVTSSSLPATIPAAESAFPDDIEHLINDLVVMDDRDMYGTMSLVASRFYAWTKPITFRTAVIRLRDNWQERISNLLVPNASFIRVLALDLPFTRDRLSDEELSCIRQLLEASEHVTHMAVVWNIWAHFRLQCGSFPLESLYLIWDGAHYVPPPSLKYLQHPFTLKELTVYAPPDLYDPDTYDAWGRNLLPDTTHCVNLAYVAYAADRMPLPSLCEEFPRSTEVMFVRVDIPEKYAKEWEDPLIKKDMEIYPHFSTTYVRHSHGIVGEWLAKMEGRKSVLDHPPPHDVGYDVRDSK